MARDFTEYIAAVKNGDFKAFEIIFDGYWYDLYKYARQILEDHDEAEDLVQQLFCDLWEGRETLNVQTSIRSYLFGGLRKKILKNFRDKGIREKHREILVNILNSTTQPFNAIANKDLFDILIRQLEVLPSREREVFMLSQIDGYSVKEIAQRCDTSEQTVRNQISSAVNKITPVLMRLLS